MSVSPAIARSVADVPALAHRQAMVLAETEYRRFAALLADLGPDDWQTATECAPWTVRDMASHVLGYMRACSSVREQVRQIRAAKRRGGPIADAMSALQVEELAELTGNQIQEEVSARIDSATRGRRTVPWPVRRFARITADLPVAGAKETWTLGFLVDIIGTRDTWMHRIDISQACGRSPDLDADHDARLIADIVAEWARRHERPFQLHLTGPAGGSFRSGTDGPTLQFDALEFCRALSGRTDSVPFDTEVPF